MPRYASKPTSSIIIQSELANQTRAKGSASTSLDSYASVTYRAATDVEIHLYLSNTQASAADGICLRLIRLLLTEIVTGGLLGRQQGNNEEMISRGDEESGETRR
jgi:hypothetical protein